MTNEDSSRCSRVRRSLESDRSEATPEQRIKGSRAIETSRAGLSDLQLAKVRNAGLHFFQVHFHEVILDAAYFCGGKDLLPVQTVLSDRHDLLGFGGPALHVHRNKATRILREIRGGIVAFADGRNLKLELDQLRIEQAEQYVVGPFALHHRELKVFVVKSLLNAGLGGSLSHFVVFIGGPLHLIQGRVFWSVEAGHEHLCQADILRPTDSALLILP